MFLRKSNGDTRKINKNSVKLSKCLQNYRNEYYLQIIKKKLKELKKDNSTEGDCIRMHTSVKIKDIQYFIDILMLVLGMKINNTNATVQGVKQYVEKHKSEMAFEDDIDDICDKKSKLFKSFVNIVIHLHLVEKNCNPSTVELNIIKQNTYLLSNDEKEKIENPHLMYLDQMSDKLKLLISFLEYITENFEDINTCITHRIEFVEDEYIDHIADYLSLSYIDKYGKDIRNSNMFYSITQKLHQKIQGITLRETTTDQQLVKYIDFIEKFSLQQLKTLTYTAISFQIDSLLALLGIKYAIDIGNSSENDIRNRYSYSGADSRYINSVMIDIEKICNKVKQNL